MKGRDFLRLTIPNDLSYLPVVRLCVLETAKMFGFTDEELFKIELALEEAVVNVIEHGFEDDEGGTFDIICERIPRGMEIVIKEMGIPFDPDATPDIGPATDVEEIPSTGLGTLLMKKTMDRIMFRNLGRDGKETRMTKYSAKKRVHELLAREEETPGTAPLRGPAVITERIDYIVRRMEPHEAIEVSKGAYRSHGYSFFDDHIYYPDHIIELNRNGQMVSAVAVTREGEFMGHAALVYPVPASRIAEATFFFVNPEYRSQGCMNRMYEFLVATDKRYPITGVYGYAVTKHLFSQKTAARHGFGDCAIELATSPETWIFKGIDGDNSQRVSVVASFKYLEDPVPLTLYPPARHRDMVARLYRGLGVEHKLATPVESSLQWTDHRSMIDVSTNTTEGCTEVYVARYGRGALGEVKGLLRELCVKQIAAINLYLNMEDPATYFLVPKLEEMGFFFSGILPMTAIGDTLILQYLNNVDFDYEKVMTYSDTAREILDYVRRCDPNSGS